MSSGYVVNGANHPYYSGSYKLWSGLDDQARKAWNPYNMVAGSRSINDGPHDGMGIGFKTPHFTDDSYLRLLDQLSQNVRQHEFNAGVFLGQSKEVANSIVGTATAFAGISRSLKRGDLEGALRFLPRIVGGADKSAAKKKLNTRDIAGAHLSLVYGWLPLLSDVHAAAEALEVLANPPRRSSVTAVRGQKVAYEGSQSPSNYSCPCSGHVSQKILYTISEELDVPRSLGLLDPVSVAWELVPYSFVVDWFVPIGSYLSNLAIIPNLIGTFGTTEKYRSSGSCVAILPQYEGSSASGYEAGFRRFLLAHNLSVPLPQFRGFSQLYGSSQRSLNAIALMRNLFK